MGWFGRLLPRQRSKLAANDEEHAMSEEENEPFAMQ
jgi:hypothetical protein